MKRFLSALIFSAVLLTGCQTPPNGSTGTEETITTSDLNVCELYTDTLIKEVVGENYNTNPIQFAEDTPGCRFTNTDDDELDARNFNMIVRRTPDEETAADEYVRAVDVWKNGNMPEESQRTFVDVDDIGTRAFWTYGSETSQLITYNENVLLILTLGHLDLEDEELLEKAHIITDVTFEAL